jgi:7-cyano-7-deazaguanine reductase
LGDDHDRIHAATANRGEQGVKLYLETFREEGIFHEHLVTTIRDDFVAALDPLSLDVTANFNSRGGIAISATSSYDAEVAVRD